MKQLNLTGERFGKLVAIKTIGKNKNGGYLWKCKCDCGNEIMANVGNLKNGHTKSCGCPEPNGCKWFDHMAAKHLNLTSTDIQQRYDTYNEVFYGNN